MNRLERVHRRLGHPSNNLLAQMLRRQRLQRVSLNSHVTYTAQSAKRMRHIVPARLSNPARAKELGEILAMDFSYLTTPQGENLQILNLIDEASKFHVARIANRGFVPPYSDLGNFDDVSRH